MADLEAFRAETRAWLEANCPAEMRQPMRGEKDLCWGGRHFQFQSEAQKQWLDVMAARGWTVPDWPREYGGGGLSPAETKILKGEMRDLGCHLPLTSFGTSFLDFDYDGRLDLVTVSGTVKVIKEQRLAGDAHPLRQPNQLYRQNADARFEMLPLDDLLEVSRGLAVGDLDRDGALDFVVTNNGGPVRVYLGRLEAGRVDGAFSSVLY